MIGLCGDIHPSNVDLKSTKAKIPPNGQRKNESTFCSHHVVFTSAIFHKRINVLSAPKNEHLHDRIVQ
jgi:hypothetical protein